MRYLEFFCEHWFFAICVGIFVLCLVDCIMTNLQNIFVHIHNTFVHIYNTKRNQNITDLKIEEMKEKRGQSDTQS